MKTMSTENMDNKDNNSKSFTAPRVVATLAQKGKAAAQKAIAMEQFKLLVARIKEQTIARFVAAATGATDPDAIAQAVASAAESLVQNLFQGQAPSAGPGVTALTEEQPNQSENAVQMPQRLPVMPERTIQKVEMMDGGASPAQPVFASPKSDRTSTHASVVAQAPNAQPGSVAPEVPPAPFVPSTVAIPYTKASAAAPKIAPGWQPVFTAPPLPPPDGTADAKGFLSRLAAFVPAKPATPSNSAPPSVVSVIPPRSAAASASATSSQPTPVMALPVPALPASATPAPVSVSVSSNAALAVEDRTYRVPVRQSPMTALLPSVPKMPASARQTELQNMKGPKLRVLAEHYRRPDNKPLMTYAEALHMDIDAVRHTLLVHEITVGGVSDDLGLVWRSDSGVR